MERKDLLKFCRYYKGEKSAPDNASMFWGYEAAWIDRMLDKGYNFGNELQDYLSYGLAGFSISDDTPITLKALLFNRFCHWQGVNIEDFKTWYKTQYYAE